MAKKQFIIPALFFTGILSIFISVYLDQDNGEFEVGSLIKAKVEYHLGKVQILRRGVNKSEAIRKSQWLYEKDQLMTANDGDVSIVFDNGYQIRPLPQSQLHFQSLNGVLEVVIHKGEIQIEEHGQGKTYIVQSGHRQSIEDYQEEILKKLNQPEESQQPKKVALNKKSLEPEHIQNVLKTHRTSFFRCYASLQQRRPGLTGEANLSFAINPSGNVASPEVALSTISDKKFQSCLIQVIERIQFPSFEGDQISTVFPLKFK